MAEAARSRRAVLGSLILSVTGTAALWRFLTPRRGEGTALDAGLSVAEADVPVGGALVLPEKRCAIVRNGDALVALDLTCTHLGCTVTATPEGFACPCHGSRFSNEGEVLKGPAPRALKRLRIDRAGGTVRVLRS